MLKGLRLIKIGDLCNNNVKVKIKEAESRAAWSSEYDFPQQQLLEFVDFEESSEDE